MRSWMRPSALAALLAALLALSGAQIAGAATPRVASRVTLQAATGGVRGKVRSSDMACLRRRVIVIHDASTKAALARARSNKRGGWSTALHFNGRVYATVKRRSLRAVICRASKPSRVVMLSSGSTGPASTKLTVACQGCGMDPGVGRTCPHSTNVTIYGLLSPDSGGSKIEATYYTDLGLFHDVFLTTNSNGGWSFTYNPGGATTYESSMTFQFHGDANRPGTIATFSCWVS